MVSLWQPPQELDDDEKRILGRLRRVRTLLVFLRLHRHELLDSSLQRELIEMYRATGAGKPPVPPGQLALAVLVQSYLRVSDALMVELTLLDRSVQMVLDCRNAERPAFSQGALVDFRRRLLANQMDRRLLERIVGIARARGGFDPRKLPSLLRLTLEARRSHERDEPSDPAQRSIRSAHFSDAPPATPWWSRESSRG